MTITEEILQKYKKQIDQLSTETITLIAHDYQNALEAAHKGIMQVTPEKKNELEYLEYIAKLMQEMAKGIIDQRS